MPTMEAKRKRHQAVGRHLMKKKKKIYIYLDLQLGIQRGTGVFMRRWVRKCFGSLKSSMREKIFGKYKIGE